MAENLGKYSRVRKAGKQVFSMDSTNLDTVGSNDCSIRQGKSALDQSQSFQQPEIRETYAPNQGIDQKSGNGNPEIRAGNGRKCHKISIKNSSGELSDEEYLKRGVRKLRKIPPENITPRTFEKCFMPDDRKPSFSDFLQFRRVEN